jgi:hypothetical protein
MNIVFLNAAYREGITIKDENVKYILSESVDSITNEQIFGRMRRDTEAFYIFANKSHQKQAIRNLKNLSTNL